MNPLTKSMLFVFILNVICWHLSLAAPRISSEVNDEIEWLKSISDAVDQVNSYAGENVGNDQDGPNRCFMTRKVCYGEYGCFSTNGPMGHTRALPKSPEHIQTKFYAYNPDDMDKEHLIDAFDSQTFNVIDSSKTLVIIVHGYTSDYQYDILVDVKNSMFRYADDNTGTIIMVDWKRGAKAPNYIQAAVNTQLVGRQVTHLVNELHKHADVKFENVYLIGFSLGAQVCGFAGKWSQSKYQWKYGRITGLDAAAPLFEPFEGSYLTHKDATFVDSIHTSIGNNILAAQLGFTRPYAHIDFYPNGGNNQPKCKPFTGITCNHRASVIYYNASLAAYDQCKFTGHLCDNYEDYLDGQCTKADSIMGYYADVTLYPESYGKQYLETSDSYPFCDKN